MVKGPTQQAFIGELTGFRSGPSGFAETGGRETSRPKPFAQSRRLFGDAVDAKKAP